MYMIDLMKLDTAITYIKRIAEGNDPVTNKPTENDSTLNNPNIIRCMYFVQEVLELLRDNGGMIESRKKSAKEPFPYQVLDNYVYEKDKSISFIMSQIKEMINNPDVKMISYRPITDWLKAAGYLDEKVDLRTGKKISVSTEKGAQLGIYMEDRTSMRGDTYQVVMYDRRAQEFLINNMEAIVNGEVVDVSV